MVPSEESTKLTAVISQEVVENRFAARMMVTSRVAAESGGTLFDGLAIVPTVRAGHTTETVRSGEK